MGGGGANPALGYLASAVSGPCTGKGQGDNTTGTRSGKKHIFRLVIRWEEVTSIKLCMVVLISRIEGTYCNMRVRYMYITWNLKLKHRLRLTAARGPSPKPVAIKPVAASVQVSFS